MRPIEPPDPAMLDDATRELVELTGVRNDGSPLAIVEVLAHRPELVAPFLHWSAALAGTGALGARRHELAALRASWHYGSDYEWGNHARYARIAGITETELASLGRIDGALEFHDEVDRLVIELVDEMVEGRGGPTRDRLAARIGAPALVELVWTVGHYVGLSLVADALALPVDGLERAPSHPDR